MRTWQKVMLGALLAVGLSGCASPAADPDEVQDWLAEQDAVEVPGSLASMSGAASGETDAIDADGIAVTFDEPEDIATIVFSCFGPEVMSVDVTTDAADAAGATISQGVRTEDLACADSPHSIEQRQDGAAKVLIEGRSADAQGAWSAFVVGKD